MPRHVSLSLLAVLALVVTFTAGLAADEKAAKKPLGSWTKPVGERTLTFDIKADTLIVTLAEGDKSFVATAAYGVTSEGVLFGTFTKIEKKGLEEGPAKGDLFSFAFSATKDELTVSDLKGTKVNEEAAKHVEGVYKKK
jgi:hypothetical protein